MKTQTQAEYDRNIRTAYVAMDALQSLVDRGLIDSDRIAKAMASIREVINEIESTPIRTRKEKVAPKPE
jgi:hypothetical protein